MLSDSDISKWVKAAQKAASDKEQIAARSELAKFTAETFSQVGEELYVMGLEHNDDEIVAISLLLRIGGQLTSASADLFADGRHYAAAALLRQMVEIEYLAWAFESRDNDAQRWLRSNADERRTFFTPAKLRKAAAGKFRGKDYGYHCELGGHPVPDSISLFQDDDKLSQILLSDLLGHTGRIWDHLLDWSVSNEHAFPIHRRKEVMYMKYSSWKKADELTLLPSPPAPNFAPYAKR